MNATQPLPARVRPKTGEAAAERSRPLTPAQSDLAASCYPLAIRLAAKASARGLDFHACLDAATKGLVRAAQGFDPARGFKFTTYAVHGIRFAIATAFKNAATSPVPTPVTDLEWDEDGADVVSALPAPGDRPYFDPLDVPGLLAALGEHLPDRHWRVLVWRFAEGLTFAEVAGRVGTTKERARQLVLLALETLQRAIREGRVAGLQEGGAYGEVTQG